MQRSTVPYAVEVEGKETQGKNVRVLKVTFSLIKIYLLRVIKFNFKIYQKIKFNFSKFFEHKILYFIKKY